MQGRKDKRGHAWSAVFIDLLKGCADNVQQISDMRMETSIEQLVDSSPPVRRKTPRHNHRGAAAKVHGKSNITNGKSLLPTASGRSIWARLTRDTLQALLTHCGGADAVSETQRLAARRVSVLEAELIFLEDQFALTREQGGEPEPATLDLYGRLADRQRRLSEPLGWRRSQREVSWRDKWAAEAQAEGDATVDAVIVEPAGASEEQPS
jgi:hypothetical protein